MSAAVEHPITAPPPPPPHIISAGVIVHFTAVQTLSTVRLLRQKQTTSLPGLHKDRMYFL